MDMEKKKRVLVDVVNDARKLLEHLPGIEDASIQEPAEMLRRILRENITDGKELPYAEKPADILVSPIDPDARYGAKSKQKRFTGYKANITETTGSCFITNINAMRVTVPTESQWSRSSPNRRLSVLFLRSSSATLRMPMASSGKN